MLPLQQAFEIKESIREYLKATFGFKVKEVHNAFYNFIDHKREGMFKGPYVSLKLPFRVESEHEVPLEIKPDFPPYQHQYKAFDRLSTKNGDASPTLLTTGTGSGKTESFLYPLLDYCHKKKGKKGIKAIILYPMNALATDQAMRLAEIIDKDERLKGNITAGLFIGEGQGTNRQLPKAMGPKNIIEDRNVIVDSPPDILLTNFKMLDYGLMRSEYHDLWTHNFKSIDLLKFLVLDEIHTYDGAQGTDVANLIRRLKLKLEIPKGQLCPIGTSATVSSGTQGKEQLLNYASTIFGEEFTQDSILLEERLSADEFMPDSNDDFIPRAIGIKQAMLGQHSDYEHYISQQKKLWQLPEDISKVELGEELKKLLIVKQLMAICTERVKSLDEIIDELRFKNADFAALASNEFDAKIELLNSLFALLAEAKINDKLQFPFVYLQVHLWVRELSGVLREVDDEPKFVWNEQINTERHAALPPYFCRECGASGWIGVKDDNKNAFDLDPNKSYDYYFSHHKNLYLLNYNEDKYQPIEEYDASNLDKRFVDKDVLSLYDTTNEDRVDLLFTRKVNNNKTDHVCPECNSSNTINIIGTRVPTLASIAVSQVISSNLDSRNEKFRKVLAFTNSVQDAAHQAGFIESRNFRFTFRTSLQKIINQQKEPISLSELNDKFLSYWKTHADPLNKNHLDAYFYRFFPSDLQGRATVEDYKVKGKPTPAFYKEYEQRLSWEILSEFGYDARIGRTLEKTGTAGVAIDSELLIQLFNHLESWFEENNVTATKGSFLKFISGLIYRLRTRGALSSPFYEKFRQGQLKLWDLNWMKDKRHFLNKNFHPRSRLPKLITFLEHKAGILDSTFTKNTNWFHKYFEKSFGCKITMAEIINDFYELLITAATSTGIFDEAIDKKGKPNYALNPKVFYVSSKQIKLACTDCQSTVHTEQRDSSLIGSSCQNYRCAGHYEEDPIQGFNYYQLVYNRELSPRIYAAEHTGILDRPNRENIEVDFKTRPKHNSLNAMVATSTLEMGIDVGSLDSTMNNSIPPLPANFLQRIGRAGRSSGAALITNFAQKKAHDLYYYSEPKEMLNGEVHTPGCFINAKEILLRQFTAYLIDCWTKENPVENKIPNLVLNLALRTTDIHDSGFFISRLINYQTKEADNLLEAFIDQYGDSINRDSIDGLTKNVKEEHLATRLITAFINLKNEILDIEKKKSAIIKYIKDNNIQKTSDEYQELNKEINGLKNVSVVINKRQVLEHMTNIGLLPNYAFPETGATLNARVYKPKAKEAAEDAKDTQFEFVRSSSAAIREFAPHNKFYSQGHSFEVSGINTYNWSGDQSTLTEMRFCSRCDHIQPLSLSENKPCPKCGDVSFMSQANIHKFALVEGFKSDTTEAKSHIDDTKDERDSQFYVITNHFDFDAKSSQGAYGLKEIPFGIEYVKKVKHLQTNLGLSSAKNANHITVNQHENVPKHGFVTCKYCGKSTSLPGITANEPENFHYRYCRQRDSIYNGSSDQTFEEVFLYRSTSTEVIKILLPTQQLDSEEKLSLFQAGLDLGLKKYYNGNPSHIRFIKYSEFNLQTGRFDKYLLMYDTIPGGTGYLHELFSINEFTKLLTLAYQNIRECSCQHHDKDGCYKCILSYSNQFDSDVLSRKNAEELFYEILNKTNHWQKLPTGLNGLTNTGEIEESELETRFVRVIKKYCIENKLRFDEKVIDGVKCYYFELKTPKNEIRTFLIKPQINLSKAQNVKYSTRADFLISYVDGAAIGTINNLKKVAVYLDGYQYHASESNFNFYKDIEKRESILKSEQFLSWTLSWEDLTLFEEAKEDSFSLQNRNFTESKTLAKHIMSNQKVQFSETIVNNSSNNLLRLFGYLMCDKIEGEISYFLKCFNSNIRDRIYENHNETYLLDGNMDVSLIPKAASMEKLENLLCLSEEVSTTAFCSRAVSTFSSTYTASSLNVKRTGVINKDDWNLFWRLFNLQQLTERFMLQLGDSKQEQEELKHENIDLLETLELFDSKFHGLIKDLFKHNISWNNEAFLVTDDNGNELAMAEIGLTNQKVVFEPCDETSRKYFVENGYTIVDISIYNINDFRS